MVPLIHPDPAKNRACPERRHLKYAGDCGFKILLKREMRARMMDF
jgi:hypothetical protein